MECSLSLTTFALLIKIVKSVGGVKTENVKSIPAGVDFRKFDFNIDGGKIRDELGISDSLVRLSIGIEDPEDLKTALENSLNIL